MPSDTSRLLAIDIGTKLGWCVMYDGQPIEIGVWNVDKVHSHPQDFERWLHIDRFIQAKIDAHKITGLVFEFVHAATFASSRATELHCGARAIIQMAAHRNGIEPVGIPVNTIKACVCKGGAKKEQIIEAVSRLGFAVMDDNEADAVAVAVTALRIEAGLHDVSHLKPTGRRKKTGGKKSKAKAPAKKKGKK